MASLASNLASRGQIYKRRLARLAVINREFNSLSFTKRRAPEFASQLESPRLKDLLYYANVIKAAAKAIKATDKYNRIAANRL
ncbi:hypothetical protein LY76DRAFT_599679 [Colletotrichum caudatum]|nr:hypothetical protein LY76DRAFT_599679 [Colletotrichum caudatum]